MLEKVTQLVAQAMVGARKKEVIINSKTTTLPYLSGKRSNKIKVVNIFTFLFISQL